MNQWEAAVSMGMYDPSTAIGGPPDAVLIVISISIVIGMLLYIHSMRICAGDAT